MKSIFVLYELVQRIDEDSWRWIEYIPKGYFETRGLANQAIEELGGNQIEDYCEGEYTEPYEKHLKYRPVQLELNKLF